ncbi:hypothetical protein FOL47_002436 [Perkinsus chesapeaki]|uniref:Uncharacterized protein n=1 Tax=Perkinsus chesapeaki TaxID=330153 RepID=A0A7J6MEL2_PERCH|nr:hypothetical protein FOL47_002436 [Perkinsus chesapeaki]
MRRNALLQSYQPSQGGYLSLADYWWSNRSARIAREKLGPDEDICHFHAHEEGPQTDLENIRNASRNRIGNDKVNPDFTVKWLDDTWLKYKGVLWRVGHFPSDSLECEDPLPQQCDEGWCLIILPSNEDGTAIARRMSEVTGDRFTVQETSNRPSMNPNGESLLSRLDLVGFGILGQSKAFLDHTVDAIFGTPTRARSPHHGCPLVVFLPSFAEHYAARQVPMSIDLAQRGTCGMILLENPLRGRRALPNSIDAERLRDLSQFLAFAVRSVSDTRSILHWIDEKIRPDRLCVGGLSIGASIATMSALTVKNLSVPTLPLCAFFPAASASSTWTHERSAMRPYVNPRLDREYIEEATAITDITTYPKLGEFDNVELLGARHDAIILGENTERLSEYLGCPIRWVRGGHVTGALLQQYEFMQAITRMVTKIST